MVAQVMARKICNVELGGGLKESKKSVASTGTKATREYLESRQGAFGPDGCIADVCIPAALLATGRTMKAWLPMYLERYQYELNKDVFYDEAGNLWHRIVTSMNDNFPIPQ
eukprot:SAG31_NODE_26476_length_441_cov_1.350877_1_plen_110_part_10